MKRGRIYSTIHTSNLSNLFKTNNWYTYTIISLLALHYYLCCGHILAAVSAKQNQSKLYIVGTLEVTLKYYREVLLFPFWHSSINI